MEVKEVENKREWEDFLLGCSEKTFLQSWNWGEFQERMGNKIWRLGIYEGIKMQNLALVVKIKAKRGNFLLIPHLVGVSEILLNKLKEIAGKEKISFIRIPSLLARNEENRKLFQDFGFRKAPIHANAYEATLKLDLTPLREDLLMNMRKTTRYFIRQGLKKKQIKIEKSENPEDVKIFNEISQRMARYKKFVPFSFEFTKNEFKVFTKDNQALLFFGKYREEIIGSALVIFWSGIGFYHQAALDPKFHRIPISYLLQWEAIKEAKKRGCKLYDFWGYVDPKKYPNHPWAGPTLFKKGFGGNVYEYVKTQDLPLSRKYWFTYLFEKLRKVKRGL